MANGRYTNQTPERDRIFFDEFARSANVTAACAIAGYARSHVYERRKSEPEFAKRWENADHEATSNLEAEVYRRATFGVHRSEPIMYLGQVVATREIDEYSDTLAIFLLKARNPDKYREKIEVNVNWRAELRQSGIDPEQYFNQMIDAARLQLEQSVEIIDVTTSMTDVENNDNAKRNTAEQTLDGFRTNDG